MTRDGKTSWFEAKGLMDGRSLTLGAHASFWLRRSPRRLLHALSYYKFAAKLIGPGRSVLDVGCAEGLGTWLLAKECGRALGIDLDAEALERARANWPPDRASFLERDFRGGGLGTFDAAVSFDVIEHVEAAEAPGFLREMRDCLEPDGVAVVGTPNITGQAYASEVSRAGHVNCYSGERLEAEMAAVFEQVFLFGANDEVVHTGFPPMCHYLIAVGCGRRP